MLKHMFLCDIYVLCKSFMFSIYILMYAFYFNLFIFRAQLFKAA